jgi:hypothetical protein
MNNTTIFRLIGIDEDDNALFYCSYCNDVIAIETDDNGDIDMSRIGDVCPGCGAKILRIDLD